MELQARSKERRDLCYVQRKGQKKNSRSGWAALKWMKQLFIQGRNGQVRQVGNNNHRAICCPGTLHPQGMKQILSSRSSSSVAVTSLSSKQCLNRALKFYVSCKSCSTSLTHNSKSKENSVLLTRFSILTKCSMNTKEIHYMKSHYHFQLTWKNLFNLSFLKKDQFSYWF